MSIRAGPFVALEEAAARQEAEETAARLLATARAQLILGRDAPSAFFATLLLRLRSRPDWSVETMATDGRELLYSPQFVNGLTPATLRGVLAHEVMHNALAHHARRVGREPRLWNIACDLAINPILRAAGMSLPDGHLMPGEGRFGELVPGKSAEEYYSSLMENQESKEQSPSASESQDPGGCGQVIDPDQGDPAQVQASEAEWKVAVAQAQQAAIGRGPLPGGLGRSVEQVLHPPADWRSVLREFVSAHARNDYSWSRPNRRFIAQGLYLPGLHSEELGDVVLAVDTSGSIGARELGIFAEEANAVLASYDCSVTVLYHDTEVQKVQIWRSSDGPLVLDAIGGGGTSHVCVFDWIAQAGDRPACVICLTDLETEFPSVIPDLPVLWAVTGGQLSAAPFGRVIPLLS